MLSLSRNAGVNDGVRPLARTTRVMRSLATTTLVVAQIALIALPRNGNAQGTSQPAVPAAAASRCARAWPIRSASCVRACRRGCASC